MKLGIFGFPKVGKTTLFNLLTQQEAATDKFATGRSAPNIASARVADPRVDRLQAMYEPKKTTYATVQYVDIAGVKQGELKEGVDLAPLRPVDALLHVVRAFDDPEIEHAAGAIDPKRDIESMEEELLLTDLIATEGRLEKLELELKKRKDDQLGKERDALALLKQTLDAGQPARAAELDENSWRLLRGFQFLSAKPILHVINLGEERQEACKDVVESFQLADIAGHRQTMVTYILGQIEMEISRLEGEDAREFLSEYGLTESGLDRIVQTSYALLGQISFFTVGEDEVRAWTIRAGTAAEDAPGFIHSDIKRGFIRAEIMPYDELIAKGSIKAMKDAGLFRLEGRNYIVQDGEIAHFRFNV